METQSIVVYSSQSSTEETGADEEDTDTEHRVEPSSPGCEETEQQKDEEKGKERETKKRKIEINMTQIPCIPSYEQDEELRALGVTVYDQSRYEEGVMKQLDQVLEDEAQVLVDNNKPSHRLPPDTQPRQMKSGHNALQSLFNNDTSSRSSLIYPTVIKSEPVDESDSDSATSFDDDMLGQQEERPKSDDEWVPSAEEDGHELSVDEEQEVDDDDEDFAVDEPSSSKRKAKSGLKRPLKRLKGDEEMALELKQEQLKSSLKKIIDDGNEKTYLKRMKEHRRQLLVEKQKSICNNNGVAEEDTFTDIDGCKVPDKIWKRLFPYQQIGVRWLWELHQASCGGIMGDEMGLGKTIQVIAFLAGLSCSQVTNFREEYTTLGPVVLVCPATVMYQWVQEFRTWWPAFRVAILHHTGSFPGKKNSLIRQINRCNGILITSYSGIISHQDILYEFDWHYVILDEGHKIRNPDAQVTLACKRFRTPHRLILSGSPIQNNLKELWSLFDFVYPGKLGTLPVFMEKFAVPITQGGYSNANSVQVQVAYKCATVLRDTIKPYLLRRMKEDVKDTLRLPAKNEQVLFCRLTDDQRNVYQSYIESPTIKDILKGSTQVFVGLINLRKICNHPDLFTGGPSLDDAPSCERDEYGHHKRSGKMKVVDALLGLWSKQKHKVLLFTQGTQMLSIIEKFIRHRGYTYLLMDGSTPIASRQQLIKQFNLDSNLFIFLLTTRVGGIGVNLTGASRVLIYDPDWNPSTDLQARERAWRIGQNNQVTIYRLLTTGTIEEKIYHRQVFKQYLTNRVLKDPKQRRFFKTNDLHELFALGDDGASTESSAIFAGTGSNVKVNQNAKNPKQKSNVEKLSKSTAPKETEICLSEEKILELREKAKMLSQMLAKKFPKVAVNGSVKSVVSEEPAESSSEKVEKASTKVRDESCSSSSIKAASTNNETERRANSVEKEMGEKKGKKKSKKKKRTKKKGAVFEGEHIKYLVKQDAYQEMNEKEVAVSKKQDDYVLKKLFKKSTMHSALQHDVIEGAANPDYAVVECEAERVATDAIKALKRSRELCMGATSGMATWTGLNGESGAPRKSQRPKFGPKKGFPSASSSTNIDTNVSTSSNLLDAMRNRKRLDIPQAIGEPEEGGEMPPSSEYEELLRDIRHFIACQAKGDGQATTQEVLDQFKGRLPRSQTPVFKSLLWRICDFSRSNGIGIWRLKEEFR